MTKIQVKHNGVMQKVTQSVHFIQCKVNKKTVCMQSNTFPTQHIPAVHCLFPAGLSFLQTAEQ